MRKVKVRLVYGKRCETGCSTSVCFVRREQDKIYDAILVEGEDCSKGDGDCAYWSNTHRPKTTHVVVITDNGEEHALGGARYEIVKDTGKKKSAPKKVTPRLNKKDFNDQLKDLI